MTLRRILTVLTCLLLVAAATAGATEIREFAPVQAGFTDQTDSALPYAPDRVLIKLHPSPAKALTAVSRELGAEVPNARLGIPGVDALALRAGVRRIERPFVQPANVAKAAGLGTDRWFMLYVADGDMVALAEALAADPAVESAQPDWCAYPAAVPNDPLYADHWGHNNTAQMISYDWATYTHTGPTVGTVGFDANAESAWETTYGSSNVVIAIVDSGVDIYHEDLNCMTGYDFGDNDTNPMDDSRSAGHGTCCAGIAAAVANNGTGIVGIAGGATIMPLKVADRRGSMYFSAITNAIYYAADNGADVISMSLSAAISSDAATDAAILYAYNAGCVILAATSNYNLSTVNYPANNQYVVAVGAASPCGERKRSSSLLTELNPGVAADPNGYTCDGERWWGSNYGTTTQDGPGSVDIIAPTILPTTDISGSAGYDAGNYDMFFNGTSCSTPYAAGVVALIKTVYPTYSAQQLRDHLVDTAQDVTSVESGAGWDRYTGYGMVDAAAAVGGGGPVLNPPVADFTGAPTAGEYPLVVAFTDMSSNTPTSWSWTFGDGGTSTAQNPSYTYTAAGTYTVSLTATNQYGSDIETKIDYITATDPPVGGTMHVADINVYRVISGRKYYGRADISIVDNGGAPVAGATVTAYYTGDISGTASGVTGTDGMVTLSTSKKSYATTEYCFEVTGVTHASLSYDAGANQVTKSCEGGDMFSADNRRMQVDTALGDATPNPFNPLTRISFYVPKDSHVRLTVYDLRGRVVKVLVDGNVGIGDHVATFDGSQHSSGVYFYRLQTDDLDQTRKMVMLK